MAARPFKPDRTIALVGLMGAGKSTIGRRLARRLRLKFTDSDAEIEQAAGLAVGEIFARYGEAHFREGERRVIARLAVGPPQVIATGGGAFVDPETRAMLLERCLVVWLDAPVETLAERVARKTHRPLLHGKDPHVVLAELAERRNPFYAQAHVAVRSEDVPYDQLVDRIVGQLNQHLKTNGAP